MTDMLTALEEKFCVEYIKIGGRKGGITDAFKIAYSVNETVKNKADIYSRASKVFQRPRVQKRIQEMRDKMADSALIETADILKRWIAIAMADPNDLVSYRKSCCKFCYGKNFFEQGSEHEYALAIAHAIASKIPKNKFPKEPLGGFGYDPRRDPNPICPNCYGEGVDREFISDTRKLKGYAKYLYAGIKHTTRGIEIKMHDQAQAIENLAKYLGMYDYSKSLQKGGEGEIENVQLSVAGVDPLEAAQIYQKIMRS